jgi:glycosyltransferase involved in cell wall biosynthesis
VKNIIIVLPTLPVYRLDFLESLSNNLNKNDKKLVVISGSNIGEKNIKEILSPSFTLIKNRTVGFTFLGYKIQWQKKLFSSIVDNNPEKVIFLYHAGKINYNIIMLYLYFIAKTPYVLWSSGHKRVGLSEKKLMIRDFFKSFFTKRSSAYITYSTHYASQLSTTAYPINKIFPAQNTINIERIIQDNKNNFMYRDFSITRFLFVGALIPAKNLEKALQACRVFKKQNKLFTFDIIGDGLIKDNLIKLVYEYGLSDIVFIHGAKYGTEVANFFNKCNVFLLPGTGGLAINEAMAYGLPVITTPGDGTGYDLVNNGENGFLLDFKYTFDELINSMDFFIKIDIEKHIKMCNASQSIITSKASLSNMVNQFIKCVQS